ncbi:(2S)-3-sulfopropanediol dehydratase activating enzyme [Desulfosporosinus paludis]|uniref:(2S)-3-sulfopropanediol dehydratase activating enzyme n=1 Tax=Desulfosporosinus paludis TaxID=3115649 RepID=UPI0038901009
MGEMILFDPKNYGYVFNIQHYSVHDGPGIRTIVFLKGCPLRCKWCSNPESQQPNPELGYNPNKCIGINSCLRCAEVCIYGAVKQDQDENDKIAIDRQLCKECLLCTDACPSKALEVFGKQTSIEDIIQAVEKDSAFYSRSGGGLTFSGGEPLMQAEFVTEVLKVAHRRRINTTIETCGYADWSQLERVCQHLNSLIMDIKCIDSEKHKAFTNVSSELILENFTNLCEKFPNLPKLIRTPVIPGFNDTQEDIQAIVDFIKDRPNVRYELLPYHRLGQQKYTYLGKEYSLEGMKLDDERFNQLKGISNFR